MPVADFEAWRRDPAKARVFLIRLNIWDKTRQEVRFAYLGTQSHQTPHDRTNDEAPRNTFFRPIVLSPTNFRWSVWDQSTLRTGVEAVASYGEILLDAVENHVLIPSNAPADVVRIDDILASPRYAVEGRRLRLYFGGVPEDGFEYLSDFQLIRIGRTAKAWGTGIGAERTVTIAAVEEGKVFDQPAHNFRFGDVQDAGISGQLRPFAVGRVRGVEPTYNRETASGSRYTVHGRQTAQNMGFITVRGDRQGAPVGRSIIRWAPESEHFDMLNSFGDAQPIVVDFDGDLDPNDVRIDGPVAYRMGSVAARLCVISLGATADFAPNTASDLNEARSDTSLPIQTDKSFVGYYHPGGSGAAPTLREALTKLLSGTFDIFGTNRQGQIFFGDWRPPTEAEVVFEFDEHNLLDPVATVPTADPVSFVNFWWGENQRVHSMSELSGVAKDDPVRVKRLTNQFRLLPWPLNEADRTNVVDYPLSKPLDTFASFTLWAEDTRANRIDQEASRVYDLWGTPSIAVRLRTAGAGFGINLRDCIAVTSDRILNGRKIFRVAEVVETVRVETGGEGGRVLRVETDLLGWAHRT